VQAAKTATLAVRIVVFSAWLRMWALLTVQNSFTPLIAAVLHDIPHFVIYVRQRSMFYFEHMDLSELAQQFAVCCRLHWRVRVTTWTNHNRPLSCPRD
jgi:hypothetical protein